MKHIRGFLHAADAIVPCDVCNVQEGEPCKGSEKKPLKAGYVHFGRRIRRLLLSAKNPDKRDEFEGAAVDELVLWMNERSN